MVTKNAAYDLSCNFCVSYASYPDVGTADLSANFTLNQNYADLSANFRIGDHALLSANFTIGRTADLSANFTLNQNYADLSANFKISNPTRYFLYEVHHGGSNYTTPKPIDNLIIKRGNRDKISTCDVMFSNKDDRFSWIKPNSEFAIKVGPSANNTSKLFGGIVNKVERVEEQIIFHCKGYGEELQRKKISGTYYDIEATDLIKNHLLTNLRINPGSISFDGTMTERRNFITNDCTETADFTFTNTQLYDNNLELEHAYADDYCENHLTKYWGVTEGFQNLYIQWDDSQEKSESYCAYIKHRRMMDRSIWLGGFIDVPPGPPCGSKDLSTDFTNYEYFVFWIQHHSTYSPKLRLHTGNTGNNYFQRAISITAADTWEYKKYPVGSGASGWTEVGSPDWSDIDWYELFFDWNDWDVYDSRTYIDIWSPSNYQLTGSATSTSFNTIDKAGTIYTEYFDAVRVSLLKATPSGTSIVIKVSNDEGTTWTTVSEAVWTQLSDSHDTSPDYGQKLQFKLELTGNTLNGSADATPTISYITVDVRTKKITIYDRIEFKDQFIFDTLNEVLYDASLEGYVTPNKLFVVSGVTNKANSNPGIPYLRQGKDILTIPLFKKDARALTNSQKVIGSKNGALTSTEIDSLTEGSASEWTATGITIADSTSNLHVMEGDQCLKITIAPSSGWFDPCDDDSFNTTYYTKRETGTAPYDGEVIEGGSPWPLGDWILTKQYTLPYSDSSVAYFYFTTAAELSGNFEVSFDFRVSTGSQYFVWFVNTSPQDDDLSTMQAAWEYIWHDASVNKIYLNTGGSDVELGYYNISQTLWTNIKITRTGSDHKVYYNNELKWSGTFSKTPTNHDNIQLGHAGKNWWGNAHRYAFFKNISWNYVSGAGNVVSPSLAKNLDLYEHFFCWYEQDGSDSFELRLETDASNYYSITIKPEMLNEMYKLLLPVGNISSGWSATGSPDWTNIDNARLVYSAGNISVVYLDKLYFTIGEVVGTYEDTSSQREYGLYEAKTVIHRTVMTESECTERAKAIVEAKKTLNEPIDISVFGRRDINPGDIVKIHFPRSGITNTIFRVDEVQYILGSMFLTRLFCRDFDTFTNESLLQRLDRETKQIGD